MSVSFALRVLLESGALLGPGLFLKPRTGIFLSPMLFIGDDIRARSSHWIGSATLIRDLGSIDVT